MATESQRPMGQDGALSSLNAAIDTLNLAKEASSLTPAKTVFASTSILLATIRVSFLPVHVGHWWLMYTGLNDQQSELRRAGASLRWRLRSP